jgi:N utilization substance protein A
LVIYREIDRSSFIKIFEECILNILKRKTGTDNYSVIFNPKNEDIEIIRTFKVVADNDDYDDNDSMPISVVQQIDEDYEIGDIVSETVDIDVFNRTQLMTLRNNIVDRIKRINKLNSYNSYKDLVGEIITAEVVKYNKNETILKYDNVIIILPASNKLDKDKFIVGKLTKVHIDKINDTYKDIVIIGSRNSKDFIKKIFELEFNSIQSGEITIEDVIIVGDRIKVIVDT